MIKIRKALKKKNITNVNIKKKKKNKILTGWQPSSKEGRFEKKNKPLVSQDKKHITTN